jgi:hypothetical protein
MSNITQALTATSLAKDPENDPWTLFMIVVGASMITSVMLYIELRFDISLAPRGGKVSLPWIDAKMRIHDTVGTVGTAILSVTNPYHLAGLIVNRIRTADKSDSRFPGGKQTTIAMLTVMPRGAFVKCARLKVPNTLPTDEFSFRFTRLKRFKTDSEENLNGYGFYKRADGTAGSGTIEIPGLQYLAPGVSCSIDMLEFENVSSESPEVIDEEWKAWKFDDSKSNDSLVPTKSNIWVGSMGYNIGRKTGIWIDHDHTPDSPLTCRDVIDCLTCCSRVVNTKEVPVTKGPQALLTTERQPLLDESLDSISPV